MYEQFISKDHRRILRLFLDSTPRLLFSTMRLPFTYNTQELIIFDKGNPSTEELKYLKLLVFLKFVEHIIHSVYFLLLLRCMCS